VTIIEYGDYQSPVCAQLASVLARIRQEYPDDVRIVYRHFPLPEIHDKAQLAAEAAEAAGAQGKFWEMHELLYNTYAQWVSLSPDAFRARLEEYARQIGLDLRQFSADLSRGKFTPQIQEAYHTAMGIPVPGTPFVLYNGEPYQGPLSHWAFDTLIKLEKLTDRQYPEPPPEVIDPFRKYTATLDTERGKIVIELFADQAPLTVNNFVFLAREGWFDEVTFHRVIPGVVAQTGDPSGTGFGGPGYYVPDEINPDLKFDAAGWVGMANSGPNTNGSQFFMTLAAANDLSGSYTLFGKVVSGLDVLQKISPRDPSADPEAPPGDLIKSVTIEER
jgi:cyclophilin family peptidyl-prolyl cis-trans isomerase